MPNLGDHLKHIKKQWELGVDTNAYAARIGRLRNEGRVIDCLDMTYFDAALKTLNKTGRLPKEQKLLLESPYTQMSLRRARQDKPQASQILLITDEGDHELKEVVVVGANVAPDGSVIRLWPILTLRWSPQSKTFVMHEG